MPSNKKLLQAAAGSAGGDNLYVEDVFSTYLYAGNGNVAFDITNNIDLSGEGGMVWIKIRNATYDHNVFDTERGANKWLETNTSLGQQTATNKVDAFNADGFSLGTNSLVNGGTDQNYASWSFRKAEKFFDVVTYTGTGSARTVSHNLGSVPAVMIIKRTSTGGSNWRVYHTSLGNGQALSLNTTDAAGATTSLWNSTTPTDSVFTLGDNGNVNQSGQSFVAYLFASDAGGFGDDGDESIIKCGSFTTDGSSDAPLQNIGFEPQWIMTKSATGTADWYITDSMRDMSVSSSRYLIPNSSSAETLNAPFAVWVPHAQGFSIDGLGTAGETHIYMAIRRPMKTPEAGTEVFKPVTRTGTGTTAAVTGVGFSPDLFIGNIRDTAGYWNGVVDRLRGVPKRLVSSQTDAENTQTVITSFDMDGLSLTSDGNGFANENGKSYIQWLFKRAPGFFDVVIANASNPAVANPHNLGVVPEFIIIRRTVYTGNNWSVSTNHTSTTMTSKWLNSTSVSGQGLNTAYTANYNLLGAQPTATNFTMINQSDGPFACYLFATLAGVSKVGSYTGTGSDLNVDCGFSAGARFVLITRVDASGDWYVWDSARGIVAGNDPYLLLNSTAAEVTNTDYIDPLSSGFTVTSSAPAALNASGGTYIFLAIA